MFLRYCDYIAHVLRTSLSGAIDAGDKTIKGISTIDMDLHPVGGYMLSTKKTMVVTDMNGTLYRVTVEELNDGA